MTVTRRPVIPSLLSDRRAAAVPSTPATARLPRRRVGPRVRPLHRLLWQAQKLGGTQDSHSIIQELTDCRSRCPILYEKSEHYIPKIPPPHHNNVEPSVDDTSTCEPINEGPSAGNAKGDQWEEKEAEAADEEEESDEDKDENNPPLLHPTKKGCRSATGEKSSRNRDVKRRRFSSRLPFR